jgi:hypothetical protein
VIEYLLAQPNQDVGENVDILARKLTPILDEFWKARGKDYYKEAHWSLNPILLVELWMSRSLILILARENDETVGFLLGARMVTFFRPENYCSVEAYYGRTQEIEDGILSYLDNAFQFFPEKTLVLPIYDRPLNTFKNISYSEIRRVNVYVR